MNDWLQIALIVAGIACGLFPVFKLLMRPKVDPLSEDDDEPVLGGFTAPLAAQMPLSATGKDDIQKLLLGAGYYHPNALTDYRGIRVALTLAPLFLAGAAALILPPERFRTVAIAGVIGALLGFSLPRVWLAFQRQARGREISRGLPMAIDNLTLCLTAGQNPLAAFTTVAREMKSSHPVLAQELAITAKQAELHSLDTAVKQWADRTQVPEVSNLASLLVQSERLGTDTASTLVELSNNFRTTARQRAETQANRTSFWMLFPSVFCFWVAAAIILIGPAYLEYFEFRDRAGANLIANPQLGIDRANRRQGIPQETADGTTAIPPASSGP
jgi:tight adherence protein C